MRFVWGAPSRLNDRAYTVVSVAEAAKACDSPDLLTSLGRVGWSLDCCLGLHPEAAEEWPEWIEANREWWSLHHAVLHPPDAATARLLVAQVRQRMEALGSRLERAENDEMVLSEAAVIIDGTLMEEG